MKIVIKKGLNIPMAGAPEGPLKSLSKPRQLALNLDPFDEIRFKVHVKVGENVKVGQPLVESKSIPGQMFVSPAGGVVSEVRRGLKRRLLDIVIDVADHEEHQERSPLNLATSSQETILSRFMECGIFPHIRLRPFNLVADPAHVPRDIFVSGVETLPCVPSAEMQLEGHKEVFQAGLHALAKLTSGKVHLVHRESSPFAEMEGVEKHTIVGPHPAGNPSIHIHKIAPIRGAHDYVWTLSTLGVLTIGEQVLNGRCFTDRILSIGGNGIVEGRGGYFKARAGFPIKDLISNKTTDQLIRLISGDPLTGSKVDNQEFMGFYHTTFTAIPESVSRQPFHFLRLGLNQYSATRAYVTGHIKPPSSGYSFTTNQHGEERAFIDADVYNRVMPMRIPTLHLIKAVLSEDFELAEKLGFLEVAPEDFALPTFICPSKIEMIDIIKKGLYLYSKEMGH